MGNSVVRCNRQKQMLHSSQRKKHQEIGLGTDNTCRLLCSELCGNKAFMLRHIYWSRNIPWHIFSVLAYLPCFKTLHFLSNYVFFRDLCYQYYCQISLSTLRAKISCHFFPMHRRHFHRPHLIYSLSFVLILTHRDALKTCWCGTLQVNTAQLLRYMSPINLRTLNAGKHGEKKAPILEK